MIYIKIPFESKFALEMAMDKISKDSKFFRELEKQIIEERLCREEQK